MEGRLIQFVSSWVSSRKYPMMTAPPIGTRLYLEAGGEHHLAKNILRKFLENVGYGASEAKSRDGWRPFSISEGVSPLTPTKSRR